ncbi:MAG: phosphatase PAP2 family protein [Puniceicoccales bacterium]|jgi:membrane-associated phospholipid phosphatase|nr:phosphatase PAP2 family protein [Puniceicoccales bacterium]
MAKKLLLVLCCIITQQSFANPKAEDFGDYFQITIPTYAFGMAMNESDHEGFRQFFRSFAAIELTIGGFKTFVKEWRPDHSDRKSFPSWHTASAFFGASFVHRRYGLNRAVIPYLMAIFTGYSRVDAKRHYVHDVIAGAAISEFCTWAFVKRRNVHMSIGENGIEMALKKEF